MVMVTGATRRPPVAAPEIISDSGPSKLESDGTVMDTIV